MDGPWQIGHKSAVEYGTLASDAGQAMRQVDPSIELVVCGSSGSQMPTFGAWEETVLDLAWDVADYISVHAYYDPAAYQSIDAYLACSLDLDRMITTVASIADGVARSKPGQKRVHLSVDEWNIWRLKEHQAGTDPERPFQMAPPLAEDTHDLADALAVGCLLITLLHHADRVRIACLAQLVNVIPVIRTVTGGPAWRQTSSYPFADVARHGRGTVLRSHLVGPTYHVDDVGEVDAIELVAVHNEGIGSLTVFAVNRAARPLEVEAELRDLAGLAVDEHRVLTNPDPGAANTVDRPHRVVPAEFFGATLVGDRLSATLPARSWNVIHLSRRRSRQAADPASMADPLA
jgi:alpha-N-arabinofuranosidase